MTVGPGFLNNFLTPFGCFLIIPIHHLEAVCSHERSDLRRDCHRVLHGERTVHPFLREAVGASMETIIVGVISLLLFIYLFVAMVRPEKF